MQKKILISLIIITLIGGIINPIINNGSAVFYLNNIENNSILDNVIIKDEVIEPSNNIINSTWTQVIGDFPNGELHNGFNNSYNVAVRGKTTFTVDNTEYLLFGTGNVKDSPSSFLTKIPLPTFMTIMIIGLTGLYLLYDILNPNQLTLDLVISTIEKVFKQIFGEGCEIWYYDGFKWGQSVGNIAFIPSKGVQPHFECKLSALILSIFL